ncbi:MutS protein msh5 [Tulasnella sp. 424]|nr:MutS protein msh5 [Tulasnella sp. 424]
MATLKNGKGSINEWRALFTYHAIMLREAIGELSSSARIDIVERVRNILNREDFKILGSLINETIDWEASLNEARTCVRNNVDPQLDERKRIYDSLSIFLTKVAERIGEGVPPDIAHNLNVIYFPQLGYLITVPLRNEWRNDANMEIVPGWTFQSGEHIYFKNQDMQGQDDFQVRTFAPLTKAVSGTRQISTSTLAT